VQVSLPKLEFSKISADRLIYPKTCGLTEGRGRGGERLRHAQASGSRGRIQLWRVGVSGFHRVCSIFDLDEGKVLTAEVEGEPVAIVCSQDSVFAIRNVCSHASVPLSEGEVEDCAIECWLHGSRFDLRTGEPLGPPATRWVPVYTVTIDGEDVLVAIEEPEPR
jgi:3-phenylpropionate/trans-cinnamate dioxygenase ferredoxin subunit